MSDHNEITNDIMSFLDSNNNIDSQVEQSDADEHEELDTDDSSTEEIDDDGHEEYEDEDESTADDDDEEYDDEDDDSTESAEANNIDDHDFTVIVDGEEITVKGSELKSGYMRQANYTKKTQELANQRKALDAELTQAIERSEAVKFNATIEFERLDAALKQLGGWDGLRQQATPEQYDQFHAKYIQTRKDVELANDILKQTSNTMRSNNAKQIEQIFKDMASTKSGFTKSTINELDKFLSNRGFTEDQVLSMVTPEAWEIVYDAMQYQKLQQRTTESVKTEKKKGVESKSHKAAPAKASTGKVSNKRKFDKELSTLKNTKDTRTRDTIATDLIKKFL